jgi:hypothetical protein
MPRTARCLVAALLLAGGLSLNAQQPSTCGNQKKDMDGWKAKMTEAWSEWRGALDYEQAVTLALESAEANFLQESQAYGATLIRLDEARDATVRCHEQNGFTPKCATQERSEAAAADARAKARPAWSAARDKWHKALSALAAAERSEQGLYTKADSFERSYQHAVDAYNACLRGKPIKQ